MQPIVNMPEEDRATDIGNMHKKFGKDCACGSGDIFADRQTDSVCILITVHRISVACERMRRCRSWRTDVDGGTCVMVSVSVDCPGAKCVTGCVRGETFASHFCLQPRGSTGCRLTHFSHADIRYKPNSITLAGSKLVGDQLRTS